MYQLQIHFSEAFSFYDFSRVKRHGIFSPNEKILSRYENDIENFLKECDYNVSVEIFPRKNMGHGEIENLSQDDRLFLSLKFENKDEALKFKMKFL